MSEFLTWISIINGRKMEISRATRTHLIYQFIILTLLFVGIGYNELLPYRKFIMLLAFLPIFCYQLVILSCCMESMPVPSWLNFRQSANTRCDSTDENFEGLASSSSPVKQPMSPCTQSKKITFPEISEAVPYARRWEKSVMDLQATPKIFVCPQKSKSWVNLSDSRSSEKLSSREGSLDSLASLTEEKHTPKMQIRNDKIRNRGERAVKAKSWKAATTNFDISENNVIRSSSVKHELPLSESTDEKQEKSELGKSYSFPFRQKRLQAWLEMKEPTATTLNESRDIPYWQTISYNLAVKYEARKRRIVGNMTKSDAASEYPNLQKSLENLSESVDKQTSKKSKSVSMSKLKVGFSNLISKRKGDGTENIHLTNSNGIKPVFFKQKVKNPSWQTKEKEPLTLPELPQFLSSDRPLIFYPQHLPFEKERFESDVKKKMLELDEGQKNAQLM